MKRTRTDYCPVTDTLTIERRSLDVQGRSLESVETMIAAPFALETERGTEHILIAINRYRHRRIA
jgi:hypothetical protein